MKDNVKDKMDEIIAAVKLGEFMEKSKREESDKVLYIILATLGAIVLIAAIAFVVYRYLSPVNLEEFDDDFDDYDYVEFDDDDFVTENDISNTATIDFSKESATV